MKQKFFKSGGQSGSRGGCLKKGGLEGPYELWTLASQVAGAKYWSLLA